MAVGSDGVLHFRRSEGGLNADVVQKYQVANVAADKQADGSVQVWTLPRQASPFQGEPKGHSCVRALRMRLPYSKRCCDL
jgi:hypothetical protein